MLKGGYQIIDLQNKNHELGVGMLHEGIYDKIEGTRKAILLSGITFEGSELHDCFVVPSVNGSSFVCPITAVTGSNTVRTILVTITDTDVVTVTFAE